MDLIPLNWSRTPETKYLFNILSMCFGPYGNRGCLDVNTKDVFERINEVAMQTYLQYFGYASDVAEDKDELGGFYTNKMMLNITSQHENRLKSSVLNN